MMSTQRDHSSFLSTLDTPLSQSDFRSSTPTSRLTALSSSNNKNYEYSGHSSIAYRSKFLRNETRAPSSSRTIKHQGRTSPSVDFRLKRNTDHISSNSSINTALLHEVIDDALNSSCLAGSKAYNSKAFYRNTTSIVSSANNRTQNIKKNFSTDSSIESKSLDETIDDYRNTIKKIHLNKSSVHRHKSYMQNSNFCSFGNSRGSAVIRNGVRQKSFFDKNDNSHQSSTVQARDDDELNSSLQQKDKLSAMILSQKLYLTTDDKKDSFGSIYSGVRRKKQLESMNQKQRTDQSDCTVIISNSKGSGQHANQCRQSYSNMDKGGVVSPTTSDSGRNLSPNQPDRETHGNKAHYNDNDRRQAETNHQKKYCYKNGANSSCSDRNHDGFYGERRRNNIDNGSPDSSYGEKSKHNDDRRDDMRDTYSSNRSSENRHKVKKSSRDDDRRDDRRHAHRENRRRNDLNTVRSNRNIFYDDKDSYSSITERRSNHNTDRKSHEQDKNKNSKGSNNSPRQTRLDNEAVHHQGVRGSNSKVQPMYSTSRTRSKKKSGEETLMLFDVVDDDGKIQIVPRDLSPISSKVKNQRKPKTPTIKPNEHGHVGATTNTLSGDIIKGSSEKSSCTSQWKNNDMILLSKGHKSSEASIAVAAAALSIADHDQRFCHVESAVSMVSNMISSDKKGSKDLVAILAPSISYNDYRSLPDKAIVPVSFKKATKIMKRLLRKDMDEDKDFSCPEKRLTASDFYVRCAVFVATEIMKASPIDKVIIAQTAAEVILSFNGKERQNENWSQSADFNLRGVADEVSNVIKMLPVANSQAMASLASVTVMKEGEKSLALQRAHVKVQQAQKIETVEVNKEIDYSKEIRQTEEEEVDAILNPIRMKGSLMDSLDSDYSNCIGDDNTPICSYMEIEELVNDSAIMSINSLGQHTEAPVDKTSSSRICVVAKQAHKIGKGDLSKEAKQIKQKDEDEENILSPFRKRESLVGNSNSEGYNSISDGKIPIHGNKKMEKLLKESTIMNTNSVIQHTESQQHGKKSTNFLVQNRIEKKIRRNKKNIASISNFFGQQIENQLHDKTSSYSTVQNATVPKQKPNAQIRGDYPVCQESCVKGTIQSTVSKLLEPPANDSLEMVATTTPRIRRNCELTRKKEEITKKILRIQMRAVDEAGETTL